MAKGKAVGVHGTDAETGRDKKPGNKAKCPLTKDEFLGAAKAVAVKLGDSVLLGAAPREFASGSFGYYAGGRVTMMVGDVPVDFQVGINITAIGSVPEKKE
jgi:hypothetical protein